MKNMIRNTVTAMVVVAGLFGTVQVHANEMMVKMFLQTQDFTDYQEELAMDVVASVKSLAAEVKQTKPQVKQYFAELLEKDTMNVEEMMTAYKAWRETTDVKLEETLHTVARLHGNLTKEQRLQLLESLKKMKDRD